MAKFITTLGICLALGAAAAPAGAAVSPQEAKEMLVKRAAANLKVDAELAKSGKVAEAACDAAYAKLPGK